MSPPPRDRAMRPLRFPGAPVWCLAVLVAAGCSAGEAGEAGEPAGEAETPRPRIVAEHPVTSAAARRAGVVSETLGPQPRPRAGVVPHLPADDVGASLLFYRDLLGFQVSAAVPAGPPYERVEVSLGDARLVLVERTLLADQVAAWPPPAAVPAANGSEGSGAGVESGGSEAVGEEAEGAQAADGVGGDGAADPGGAVPGAGPSDAGDGEGAAGSGAVIALVLDDLETVSSRLDEAGAPAERSADGPAGRRVLRVVDPAGNRLLLSERAGG